MEALIVVAIVVAAAWFFLSGTYRTSFKDPETLRETELEDTFIELKKKILVTSAYDQEQAYQRAFNRINAVLGQILERHRHFVLDVEAKSANLNRLFVRREHHDANGMGYYEFSVPYDLSMTDMQSDVLLYLCFFLWHGGRVKDIGMIESDPRLMLKILDHLIEARRYSAASFFKGLVLKYGVNVYDPSKHAEARSLLELASKNGVGAAAIELEQIGKYAQLDGIKSVHFSRHGN